MESQLGTPEIRLWHKVALTLIDDAERNMDECLTTNSVDIVLKRWCNRLNDDGYLAILFICGLHPTDGVRYLKQYAEYTKNRIRRHLLSRFPADDVLLEVPELENPRVRFANLI